MDKSALSSIKNHILASLVPFLNEESASFVSRLEPVELKHGSVLYETGEQVRHVYFPNNSRGHLTIVDHAGLEAFTCECYEATRQFN